MTGNPHYAKELVEEPIQAKKTSATHAAPPKKKDDLIKSAKSKNTGDKGNPHYTKELDASEAMVKAEKSQVTGDKGNPHYAEELLEEPFKQRQHQPHKQHRPN